MKASNQQQLSIVDDYKSHMRSMESLIHKELNLSNGIGLLTNILTLIMIRNN